MPADAFNDWLTETAPHPAKDADAKASAKAKSVPASVTRGAVDLGGLTFAAPEK